MKKQLLSLHSLTLLFILMFAARIDAQTVLSTTSTYTNNNGNGTVTFNLENTNANGIMITDIAGVTGTSGNVDVEFYYNPTPINGAPGNIDGANGWVLVQSNVITGVANTTTTTTQPFLSGMSFIIPANTTYGIAIFATGQRYFTMPTGPTTISAGGVNMLAGTDISYGGGTPPAAPTFTPRGWIGEITFSPAPVCSGTPTAGVANSSSTSVCPNQVFNLSLTGQTIATGLDFQWESATSSNGPWATITGATTVSESVSQTVDTYYRCIVTCTSSSMTDTSTVVFVSTLPNLPGGTYTIGSTGDYPDFASAVAAMSCGIAGPVVFDVAPGIYNEQIEINAITGASATNTVTFKGSDPANTKLIFAQNNSNDRYTIRFNGANWVTIDSLTIEADDTGTYGWVMHLLNDANNITIKNCNIITSATSTSTNYIGIVASNSNTSYSTTGNNANNILIENNVISGGYHAIRFNGASGTPLQNINISGNQILEAYYYGVYLYYMDQPLLHQNEILMRQAGSNSSYGVYLSYASPFTVSNNIINDMGYYGIYVTNAPASSVNRSTIANNSIGGGFTNTGSFGGGIRILGTTTSYIDIFHNSINVDSGDMAGINIRVASPTNIRIQNNSLVYSGTGAGYAMYISSAASIEQIDNNNYYSTGSNFVYYDGLNRIDLPALQAVNSPVGNDINSVSGDPVYISSTYLMPLDAVLNNAAAPLASVPNDILDTLRSATTPDIGAYEFTPVNGDISLEAAVLTRSGICYNPNDTIVMTIKNIIGGTVDFSVNPLTAVWSVTGPVNSSGTVIVNSGTLNPGTSITIDDYNVDMSLPGMYTLNAYIDPNATNESAFNDTLGIPFELEVKSILSGSPAITTVTSPNDSADINANSPLFPIKPFFITEVCQFRTTTGEPVGGWPAYLTADDYIEITGVPNSDLEGITLEQWSTTALLGTYTFPSGTILGPNGTAVIAVGQLNSSVEDPSSYYYHGNGTYTGTFSSTTAAGRILKDDQGNIVDAVGYSTYAFPAAANVTATDWSGNTPTAGSTSGNRLEGPDDNTATSWINSSTFPQDPNTLNANVTLPNSPSVTGFEWSYMGTMIDTLTTTYVGPYTVNGTYEYVATYNSVCGTYTDTVHVVVNLTTADLTAMDVSCFGANDGEATASSTGGDAPFTYEWSHGPTTATITGLTPGTYIVTVWDSNNWSSTDSIVVNEPSEIITTVGVTDVNCFGGNDGEATVVVAGGTPPYNYSWSTTGQTGATASNLYAGAYSVTVTDANNCQTSENLSVTEPAQIDTSITVTDITLEVSLVGATYQWIDCTGNTNISGETNQSYTPAANGSYAAIVTLNGCSDTSSCYTISNVGIEQTASAESNLKVYPNPNNGRFIISTDKKGEYTLVNALGQTVQSIVVNSENNFQTEVTELSAGIYYLISVEGNIPVHKKIVVTK